MKIHRPVDINAIREHLKTKRSGVSLDRNSMPGPPIEYKGFKGELDADDANKLILWWEFQKHTINQNCKIADLLPSAASLPRVKSFVDGDASRGFGPLDLSSAQDMELVLVSNDLLNGWLYIIDGNHRAMAQGIRHIPFQNIPFFACVHSEMHRWAYIPMYYKQLWKLI